MAATAKKQLKKNGKPAKRAGRKKGTNEALRDSRRIVEAMDTLKNKVSYKAADAMDIIISIMEDTEAPIVARKTSAEIVLKVHKSFYDIVNGRTDPVVNDDDEEGDNPFKLLQLKFDNNEED